MVSDWEKMPIFLLPSFFNFSCHTWSFLPTDTTCFLFVSGESNETRSHTSDIHRSGLNCYGFSPATRGKRGDRLLTRHHRMSNLRHDGCVTPLPSLNNRVSSLVTSVLTDLHRGALRAINAPIASLRPAGVGRKTADPFNGDTVISSGSTSAFDGHLKPRQACQETMYRLMRERTGSFPKHDLNCKFVLKDIYIHRI